MNILIISGSTNVKSLSSALLDYIQQCLSEYDVIIERVSVNDFDSRVLSRAEYRHHQIELFIQKVNKTNGIIIASPVYQSSYSGVLKSLIDLLPQGSFANKTILPIMSGGSECHQLALNYAFKPLLMALKSEEIMSGVYISNQQSQYLEQAHKYIFDDEIIERVNNSLHCFYRSLNKNKAQTVDWRNKNAQST